MAKVTNTELINAYIEHLKTKNTSKISKADFLKRNDYTEHQIKDKFGNYQIFQEKALKKYIKSEAPSKDVILSDLIRLDIEFKKKNPDAFCPRDYYREYGTYSEKFVNLLFGNYSTFKKEALKIIEKNKKTRDDYEIKKSKNNLKKTYVVTSAVAGADVDENFFKSIKTFCNYNNAELIILPMRGVYKSDEGFDELLLDYADSMCSEMVFNTNLKAQDFKLNPQQILPLTGLARLGNKSTSMIIASPKQELISIPTNSDTEPHIIHTTGAITKPNYANNRIGSLAHQDHKLGFLIVEIASKDIFHIRQVQCFNDDGSFYDLNKLYTPTTVKTAKSDTFVLGDIHCGEEDPTAIKAWKEIINYTNPQYIILHDTFNAISISHHAINNIKEQVQRPEHLNTLEKELNYLGETLCKWEREFPDKKFYIVYSNHDNALIRYLQEGRYVFDRFNHRLALELAIYMLDNKNPIEEYIKSKFPINKNNFIWLKLDDDFKRADIQLSSHGHAGKNGSRGSLKNLETALGPCIIGHSHTPTILRDAWSVGTSTYLRTHYSTGPSSWLHASCLLYDNKQRQLIIAINGKWKTT